jgi:hypothetical protein
MHDGNISNNLRQLTHGQVKALEYDCYDINGYRLQMAKLEASRPLTATSNSGVVTSVEDASGLSTDYYVILQKIIEYTFGGLLQLKGRHRHGGHTSDLHSHQLRYESNLKLHSLLRFLL